MDNISVANSVGEIVVNNSSSTLQIPQSLENSLSLFGNTKELSQLYIDSKLRKEKNSYPPKDEYIVTSLMDDAIIGGLTSKSSNDLYENHLCKLLDITHVPEKHGWDGIDEVDVDNYEIYELKPTKSKTGSVSINDDTEKKINKSKNYEISINPFGKKKDHNCNYGWLVIATINKDTCTYEQIYKFPLEIYNDARSEYFNKTREKNKSQKKQTRITYSITISKSIDLCKKYTKKYYKWSP